MILNAALIVLLNEIIDSLIAQDPIAGINIALKDRWTEDYSCIAIGVYYAFYTFDEDCLFLDIAINHNDFIACWYF